MLITRGLRYTALLVTRCAEAVADVAKVIANLGGAIMDAVDSLADDNPPPVTDLLEIKNQLVEAKKQVAVAIGDEKQLRRRIDDYLARAEEWEQRAKAAEGDSATEAKQRWQFNMDAAHDLTEEWKSMRKVIAKLKDRLRALNDKLEDAKRKKVLDDAQTALDELTRTVGR